MNSVLYLTADETMYKKWKGGLPQSDRCMVYVYIRYNINISKIEGDGVLWWDK